MAILTTKENISRNTLLVVVVENERLQLVVEGLKLLVAMFLEG